jgi:putative drug exporter of the RND superfamily
MNGVNVQPKTGPVVAIARWSARHPLKAITLWIVLVVASVLAGSAAGAVQLSDGQEGNGESARAERVIEDGKLADPIQERALIRRKDGARVGATGTAVAQEVVERVGAIPSIGNVTSPVTSGDRTAVLVSWEITRPDPAALEAMSHAIGNVSSEHRDLKVEQVGDLSIERALNDAIGDDLGHAERLSIPITLIILLVAFGALIAAVMPLLLALSCVTIAIGLTTVASHLTPVSDAANSVILLIGLAVGVDYSMFFMRRARDERARGVAAIEAVEIAAGTAGRAIVVSGITVLISMSGMFLSGNSIFSSFAIGTMIVVATAVVGSITVLPALAARLGGWIDRPLVPFVHRLSRPNHENRLWNALLTRVLRRPVVALVLAAGALTALAIPALGMNTKLLGTEDLPRSIPIMRTYDALTAAFPGDGNAHAVVLQAPDVTTPAVTRAIAEMQKRARTSGFFAMDGASRVVVSSDHKVAEILLPYPGADDGQAAKRGLTELRQHIVPQTIGSVGTAAVTGDTAVSRDFSARLSDRLPLVFGFVLALTFVLMLISFRSVTIAAVTVLLNLLSVAAAYGLLVLVFQSHWAERLLGFESNGGIIAWLPLFLFVVLFGLSMDYHVFVLSRIREAVDRGLSTTEAIRSGVTTSAGVVTSAAVVMVGVFAVFATLTTLDFKQLGVGLASAVAIDATIVRGVLLPATMKLIGDRNWYLPSWLQWLPQVGGESHATPAPTPATAPQ